MVPIRLRKMAPLCFHGRNPPHPKVPPLAIQTGEDSVEEADSEGDDRFHSLPSHPKSKMKLAEEE